MPSPAQLRAARVMLGLSQAEIAGRSCLSVPTVKRAEADVGVRVSDAVRAAITMPRPRFGGGGGAGARSSIGRPGTIGGISRAATPNGSEPGRCGAWSGACSGASDHACGGA